MSIRRKRIFVVLVDSQGLDQQCSLIRDIGVCQMKFTIANDTLSRQ